MFSEAFLRQVGQSVEYNLRRMQRLRVERVQLLEQVAGQNFSDSGANLKVIYQALGIVLRTYTRFMVARNPKVTVKSTPDFAAEAFNYELAINDLLGKIRLDKMLAKAVTEAMFNMGVLKIGSAVTQRSDVQGRVWNIRQPVVDNVSLDNLVIDMDVGDLSDIRLIGHRFSMTEDEARARQDFDQKGLEAALAAEIERTNKGGDDRAQNLQNNVRDPSPFLKMCELWEVYLPHSRSVITLASSGWQVLKQEEFKGPPAGPYRMLRFMPIPDQVMPVSPLGELKELHLLLNNVVRKIAAQAQRQKTLLGVQSDDQDAVNVINANDGEAVALRQPDKLKEIRLGGPDNQLQGFAIQEKDAFSYYAGNLDSLDGLGMSGDTLGQEQIIAASSSQRVKAMQGQFHDFIQEVCEDLAWYLWNDPTYQVKLAKTVNETTIPIIWQGGQQWGTPEDHEVEVVPFSARDTSPEERMQTQQRILTQVVMPLAPLLAQQGLTLDVGKIIEAAARHSQMPEFNEFIKPLPPAPPPPQAEGQEAGQPMPPPMTQHTSVRVNRGGNSRQGKDRALAAALAGGANPDQQAMAQRGVA